MKTIAVLSDAELDCWEIITYTRYVDFDDDIEWHPDFVKFLNVEDDFDINNTATKSSVVESTAEYYWY